jgi:chromosome segregation ATPase
MTMTDNAVLEVLHVIQADLAAVKSDQTALRTDMSAVKSDLATVKSDQTALRSEIRSWPDLHFLQALALQQFREAGEARERQRYMEIRLNEIYSAMATGPEITGLRSEVTTSIDRQRELDLRISTIESHLGIGNPVPDGNPLAPE